MMADAATNNGTVATAAAGVAQTAATVGGGSGGALDPNVIPQWKKELIQRRKNLAKTIGAVATQVHDSASTVAAAISASSPVQTHPRTPTGGFPVGSPFYAGTGTKENTTTLSTNTSSPLEGTVPDSETLHPFPCPVEPNVHDKHSASTQQSNSNNDSTLPSVNAHQAVSSPTLPSAAAGSFMGVHFGANEHVQQQQHNNNNHHHHHHHQQQQSHRAGVGGGARVTASEAVVVQSAASGPSPSSLPTVNGAHSHSNAGSEHSGSSAAIATATNRTGTGNSSVIVERESSSTVCNSSGVVVSNTIGSSNSSNGKLAVSGVTNGQQQQQQQQPNSRDGVAARKMVAATATEEIVVVYEKNSVLGGGLDATGGGVVGGGGVGALGDAGEELKYGPGIVSRLRCRYLSLALRQSVAKQRPSLNSMRRATSLNNLLDEESEDLSEREQSIGSEGTGGGGGVGGVGHQQKKYQSQNYHNNYNHHQQQQQQQQREHYINGNGNNHNHNHNHHQQQLHPTVVLQPTYQKQQHHFAPKQQPWIQQQQQQQHKEDDQQQQQGGVAVKTAPFLRGVQNSYTRASRQVEKKNEYNRYTKHHRGASGADAVLLKRARSVEALVRYDHKAWERDGANPVAPPAIATAPVPAPAALAVSSSAEVGSNVIILDEIAQATTTITATATAAATVPAGAEVVHGGTTNGISSSVSPTAMLMNGKGTAGGAGGASSELPLLVSDCVTIEEKIINGREKGDPKPKRLTSFIDADERPPPDVVKQTMKIFEANANRRGGRGVTGTNTNEVATKVASYRSIIISGSATAGATTAAAAVSSAVGPGDKPPITHPKPPLSPKKPNIKPRTASPKQQQQHQATSAKPPPTPKSLEAVNNLKNAPGAPPTVKNNNKPLPPPMAGVGGTTIESTPPSPPARSKHTTTAAALNGSVGVVLAKNMQSNSVGGSSEGAANVAGTQSDPTDVKTNALKNGGAVRDHYNYENGTTQATPSTKTSSSASLNPGSDGGHQHKHNSNVAQEATTPATAAAVLASSSPSGICDSPSIQQLTSKLGSLHLATSTPTGAANGSVSVQDRRNLEYVTSDEEEDDEDDDVDGENVSGRRNTTSYTVNPDSSESEDARDHPGQAGGSSENDADDDDEEEEEDEEEDVNGEQRSVRKISRTAMENIARAGTTTQFRFNGAVKSYLPGAGGGGAPSTKAPAPPIPMSRESLTGKANGASSAVPIEVNGRLPPEGASATAAPSSSVNSVGNNNGSVGGSIGAIQQTSASGIGAGSGGSATSVGPSLTRREIEKNQINREKSGEPAGLASSGTNSINGTGTVGLTNAGPGTTAPAGGSSGGSGVLVGSANNANNGGGSAKQQTTANNSISAVDSTSSFVAKWGTGGAGIGGTGVTVATAGQSPLAGLVPVRKKTKPPPNHQQDGTNTMVFNFSDRKDVPDYIENDGVIIRPRPRELPKPGESGFVLLGDLTLETSTDPDDALPTGPPSPCNGEFANAYIVINGKSSMRNKTSRSNKFKIQFDDSLTSTYEYPSETSLLDMKGDDDTDNGTDTNGGLVPAAFADNGLLSHTNKLLSSVPLGSAPFASYTPVKAAIDTTFELGVTRTPSPSAASTASSTGSNGSLTSSNNSSSSNSHPAPSANNGEQKHHLPHAATVPNGHHHLPLQQQYHPHQIDRSNGVHSNGHTSNNGPTDMILNGAGEPLLLSGTGEPESIQYLKPASDEQTVNWSQGTRVTDLLF
ncbi:uncharacterized protein LOC126559646 [Anopheles maculipalpis]|uniref:uncharacterized protein LOC126559646 n=1 Tax=Anopheles maculipalpis TaxID=1496333 RepID=UPI0021598E95|nr:uncharacterized protein LOC126559646 [Anopheles maculipalpis]